LEFFSGKFRDIWAKILTTQKVCLLLHLCPQPILKLFSLPGYRHRGVGNLINMSRPSSKAPSKSSLAENLSQNLHRKEEEYQKLNAQLEAQTAKLVEEAEQRMKEHETFFSQVPPSKTPDQDSFTAKTLNSDVPVSQEACLNDDEDVVRLVNRDTNLLSIAAGAFEEQSSEEEEYLSNISRTISRTKVASASCDAGTRKVRPASGKKSGKVPTKTKSASSVKSARSAASDPSARNQFSFAKSVNTIERKMHEHLENSDTPTTTIAVDDVLPDVAEEMGAEAQIRFLKAKARVLQEELDSIAHQHHVVTEEKSKLLAQLKEAQDECERLKKNFNVQQVSLQKLKTALEEERKNTESKAAQYQSASKEVDSLKREKKQASTTHNATEVRLNRALEEIDKLKSQLQKQKFSGKETQDRDLHEIERLRTENKRHERMRVDTLALLKKQQKLIGILKRQVLHVEAAKLLSFTEDEFVRALDWGNK